MEAEARRKIAGMKKIAFFLACALFVSLICSIKVPAAETVEMTIPYIQTWTNHSNRSEVDNTFTYRLSPADSSTPQPEESRDGYYTFSASGNEQGELICHVSFTSPGYYRYQVEADVSDPQNGYTYETETYTVTLMVLNGDGGLRIGPMTIQDEDLSKYEAIPFQVSYFEQQPVAPVIPEQPTTPTEPTIPEQPTAPQQPTSPIQPVTPVTPTARTTPTRPGTVPAAVNTPAAVQAQPETQEIAEEVIPEAAPAEEDITDGQAPRANYDTGEQEETRYWALLNLLLAIATIIVCICDIVLYFRKKKDKDDDEQHQEDDEQKQKRKLWLRIATIVPAAAGVTLFLITENIHNPMRLADKWTIWHVIILVIAAVLAGCSRQKQKKEQKDAGEAKQ